MATVALDDEVQRKLQCLLDEAKAVGATARPLGTAGLTTLDIAMSRRWASKVETLLSSVFGIESHFVRDARQFAPGTVSSPNDFQHLWGVVAAAVEAWREGLVFNLRTEAEAEVEGSLLGIAAHDLADAHGVNEPERRAAAVIAGSVLERHLRGLYKAHGGTQDPEKLTIDPLGVELKKLGVIDEVQRKRIASVGAIRNSAAHDLAFKESADDVRRTIDTVTDMCARLR